MESVGVLLGAEVGLELGTAVCCIINWYCAMIILIVYQHDNDCFYFPSAQDRFAAIAHILPPIDDSQDWYMVNSDQQNGYTAMEITRQLVTCNSKDVKSIFTIFF